MSLPVIREAQVQVGRPRQHCQLSAVDHSQADLLASKGGFNAQRHPREKDAVNKTREPPRDEPLTGREKGERVRAGIPSYTGCFSWGAVALDTRGGGDAARGQRIAEKKWH